MLQSTIARRDTFWKREGMSKPEKKKKKESTGLGYYNPRS